MKVNTCSETANVILLLLAYLEECSSEFSDHGWVHPYALLHDRREAAKRSTPTARPTAFYQDSQGTDLHMKM